MKLIGKKRRREGKTNYLKRKRLLESDKPRIIVRKTNAYIIIQYVESVISQDKVKYAINSKELLKYGWPKENKGSLKSLAASYLTGIIFGRKIAKESPAILDSGLIPSTKGSRVYAAVKGIIDSGYKIKCDKKMFPTEDRIINKNVKDFFDKIKGNLK